MQYGFAVDAPVVAWIVVYAAFLFIWLPQNTFYRLFYLPPLLLAMMALAQKHSQRAPVVLVAALIGLWNFDFLIYPQSRQEFNPSLSFALSVKDRWEGGTPVVFARFHPDLWTISYFTQQASWIGLKAPDVAEVNHYLAYARTQEGTLWLEETAYQMLEQDPLGKRWLENHERREELLRFSDAKHDFQFHCIR